MEKVIFEGSQEQIDNLIKLMEGKENLPENKTHFYQTANLWCLEDVHAHYDCDDNEAMGILEETLDNGGVIENIWESLHIVAEESGLVRKNNNN